MKFLDKRTIKLGRIQSNLDEFVLDFVKILGKHTNYVIVSGYVAILFGRSRTTEDIDIIIPKITRKKFSGLFKDATKAGFWFLNSSKEGDLYELLESKSSIRAAINGQTIPNIEIKFSKTFIDNASLSSRLTVKIGNEKLFISPLELQIAYKEKVLKSFKDIEDAKHLRIVFDKNLNKEEIDFYKKEMTKNGA